jgi:HSP20 family protein
MFSRFAQWNDWDDWSDAFATLNAFRNQVERVLREEPSAGFSQPLSRDLVAHMKDAGDAFVVKAFVPGLDEKQLKLSLTEDVLTLSGERSAQAPREYTTHRKERADYTFARSFSFPTKVDPERVIAELKDGVLNVKVHKAADAKPRQITIKSN